MGRCALKCKETGIYLFPKDPVMRQKWIKALRNKHFKCSDYSRLCRKHFKESDFETLSKTTAFPLQRKILKKSAVPSIFDFNTVSNVCKKVTPQTEQLQKRNTRLHLIPSEPVTSDLHEVEENDPLLSDYNESSNKQAHEVHSELDTEEIMDVVTSSQSRMVNHATQTPILCNRLFSTEELQSNPKLVSFYTGLESYEKFKFLLNTLCPMAYDLKYRGSQVLNSSIEDQFLIMLIKLRRNTTDFELSLFFGVSKSTISNIFKTWVNFTYDLWSLLDIWPEREAVDYYMPSQFKKYHPKTRLIIDNIEIPIVKPKNKLSQQSTFSVNKNTYTLKFLVGVTPGGLFCYCSQGYGGSISDQQMVERSDVFDKCDSGDSIMADCGFNVQDIIANKNITLEIPNFRQGKSQHSRFEVKQDKLLRNRTQTGRFTELSKAYAILRTELNAFYVPLASQIFFICIMLCNFREGNTSQTKL